MEVETNSKQNNLPLKSLFRKRMEEYREKYKIHDMKFTEPIEKRNLKICRGEW